MHFERVLKQRHVLALACGAMVGWSWVLLSGMWIERAGTLGAALAFVLSLLLAALYLPPSPGALIWPQEWILCGVWAVAGIALYRRAAIVFGAHT